IDVGAYRETVLRNKIQEAAKLNLLSYATLDVLENMGELLGVSKLTADYALTTLKFSVDEPLDFDFTIPSGTEVETNDGLFIFQTTENLILTAGETEATVKAECETAGSAANNYAIGSINNLITPLSYISTVENITETSGGADDEDADSLRERIRQAPEKFSNAGSRGAYEYHTLSAHQSITDVAITSPSAGVVNIYPLTSDGNPSDEIIQIVQEYLSDDKIRPLTDYVQVLSPEKINFTIIAVLCLYLDADEDSVKETVQERLEEYKNELASRLGKDIVPTQIIAILNSISGVYKVELSTPAFQKLSDYQWANLESINITYGERTDETI
ncbi:MAG: baseplate J/gp47 family protein, partial [Candidatus Gastranaerophilales bacterium]|nr:baseplate J/gp47 family protein [Candidatus Gastranaerophilales bacterium]